MKARAMLWGTLICFGWLSTSKVALGDRLPPPKTTICNKTKVKAHLATGFEDTYAGWSTAGWQTLKPGQCHSFRTDAFHVRGKAFLRGASKKTERLCVLPSKVFRFEVTQPAIGLEKTCKKKKGELVLFHLASYKKNAPPVHITARTKAK